MSPVLAKPPTPFGPLRLLVVQPTPFCNLDCDYCFFLSKEALYPGDRFRIRRRRHGSRATIAIQSVPFEHVHIRLLERYTLTTIQPPRRLHTIDRQPDLQRG